MHISDGVVQGGVCAAAGGVAILLALYSLRKTDSKDVPRIAVMTAAFFIASLIHFPIFGFTVHLLLNGLIGVILGVSAVVAILVALLFQAILFQHGGITTLGINTITMAVPAVVAGLIFNIAKYKKNSKITVGIVSFFTGFIAVGLSVILYSGFLYLGGKEFSVTSKLLFYINMPLAVIEGVLTVVVVNFLRKVKPDMLGL